MQCLPIRVPRISHSLRDGRKRRPLFEKPSRINFGSNGQKPTHRGLFDWLAVELVDSGWSMKHLHRLIVTSNAYRMQSNPAARSASKGHHIDPENHYLWRMNPRRMEAEAVRDTL